MSQHHWPPFYGDEITKHERDRRRAQMLHDKGGHYEPDQPLDFSCGGVFRWDEATQTLIESTQLIGGVAGHLPPPATALHLPMQSRSGGDFRDGDSTGVAS